MPDIARVAAVLREQARGRQDALADEWGASPTVPPADAGPAPVTPATAREFTTATYPWRADCVIGYGPRVLAVRNGDEWRLPGWAGRRGEDPADVAVRAVRSRAGVECEITGVAYTQFLEFECRGHALPVLRAVFSAILTSDPDDLSPAADWKPVAAVADGEERDAIEAAL